MNAAIVFWSADITNYESVIILSEKVKGAINIGLEIALEKHPSDSLDIYRILGLGVLYRLGLTKILELRDQARAITKDRLEKLIEDQASFSLIASLREDFPELPYFFNAGKFVSESGSLDTEKKAIEYLAEILHSNTFIKNLA
jgi:hypothetical protein